MDAYSVRPFRNGGSQAIRLPSHLRIDTERVYVWRDPIYHHVVLSPQPDDWSELLAQLRFTPPPDFPDGRRISAGWNDQYPLGPEPWQKTLPFEQFDEFDYLIDAGSEEFNDTPRHETDHICAGQRFHLAPDAVRDLFNGHTRFVSQLQRVPIQAIAVSAIVAGLVEFGWRKYPHQAFLHHLCAELLRCAAVVPWDRSAAATYGELSAALLHDGRAMGALELLIATHALEQQATLITRNPHYQQIPALRTADWTRL